MAGSVNKVILVGRATKDPEIRTTQSGDRIANLTVATSERWTDKQSGEKKEKSEFHRVVSFNDNVSKVIESYVRKGSQVYVEGSLATRKWTDQQGVEKYTTEVVIQKFNGNLTLLDSTKSDDAPSQSYSGAKEGSVREHVDYDPEDIIPF